MSLRLINTNQKSFERFLGINKNAQNAQTPFVKLLSFRSSSLLL